jgi:hypothetical protein
MFHYKEVVSDYDIIYPANFLGVSEDIGMDETNRKKLIAKLKDLKTKGGIWKFREGTYLKSVAVEYTNDDSSAFRGWVILTEGGFPNFKGSNNIEEIISYLEKYLPSIEEKFDDIVNNIVNNIETNHYMTITDDALSEMIKTALKIEDSETIVSLMRELVEKIKEDARLEYWEKDSQFINEFGSKVTLNRAVIVLAGRFANPDEAQKLSASMHQLLGGTEFARVMGWSKGRISEFNIRRESAWKRGKKSDFPRPVGEIVGRPVWFRRHVEEFKRIMKDKEKSQQPDEDI